MDKSPHSRLSSFKIILFEYMTKNHQKEGFILSFSNMIYPYRTVLYFNPRLLNRSFANQEFSQKDNGFFFPMQVWYDIDPRLILHL